MAKFALIGGKSNKEIMTNRIERYLVSLTRKEKPILLFCPYAALNATKKSIIKFHKLMEQISCEIIDLTLENVEHFETYLNRCDIFYIAGGHCDDLIWFFKEKKLDIILEKYLDKDKIFAGSSAGAMLYTKSAMGDKYVYSDNFHLYNYKMVDCLGFLNLTICPHYQQEDLVLYNDVLKEYPYDGFGLEEDTMAVIEENQYYVIKEDKSRSVYFFDKSKNYKMIPLYEGELYEKNSSFRSKGNI